jgi:secreted PhoX family phosphatase
MVNTSRRNFIKGSLLGAGVASLGLVALSKFVAKEGDLVMGNAMGPLAPVLDEATGLPLLMLPKGFRYKTFSWAGSDLHDGYPVPGSADGMGVVRNVGSRVTLVRNHELRGSSGPIGDPDLAYDVIGGGTTTLVFDTSDETLKDSWVSLGGTVSNCAGGVTPWGSWLSCEEGPISTELFHLPAPRRQAFWNIEGARRSHGWVFEVPAQGVARPEPIIAMGQFYHEAVAFDERSSIAFLTEDQNPKAGIYRFIPDVPGKLLRGGRLQMMRVDGGRDMHDSLVPGKEMPVEWVDIRNPEQGFTSASREGDGVVNQGLAAGGSGFISLEGCTCIDGQVYFTSKFGGNARSGYVYQYDIDRERIWLIFESPGHRVFSGPDNIVMSPRGSLILCEDRVSQSTAAQNLAGLTAKGELFRFCQINPELMGHHGGHDLGRTVLHSEWAGATFSGDGQWLFVNIFNPGITVAITGPWQQGLI